MDNQNTREEDNLYMRYEKELNTQKWRINNFFKLFYDGHFNEADGSIVVDNSLEEFQRIVVVTHELMHAKLARKHYGEMLLRLETFKRKVGRVLNPIRNQIILQTYIEMTSKTYEDLESIDLEHLQDTVVNNTEFRPVLHRKLQNHGEFIEGLKFIERIEEKRQALMSEWVVIQEGGAHWLSINILKDQYADKDSQEYQVLERLEQTIVAANDHASEGINLVNKIAASWGKGWVHPILHLCLSPDISHISILHGSLKRLQDELQSTKLSPDKRLRKVVELSTQPHFVMPPSSLELSLTEILQGAFSISPLEYTALQLVLLSLDPHGTPQVPTVPEFNKYWNSLDADEEFVAMMNSLYKIAGVEEEYKPTYIDPSSYKPEPLRTLIRDKEGKVVSRINAEGEYWQAFEKATNEVVDVGLLLNTMKNVGVRSTEDR